jgi:hypothetical protein
VRIAGSIILGVIGAILYFAIEVDVAGVSLTTIGVILMVAAVIWFLVEIVQGMGQQEIARKSVEGGRQNPQAPGGGNQQAADNPNNPQGTNNPGGRQQ